ncbi:hypothetical protein ACXYMZ_05975 [Oceanobacillus sp. CAU 1775]
MGSVQLLETVQYNEVVALTIPSSIKRANSSGVLETTTPFGL